MSDPEFPFIGAGDASYFEWAEMYAYFSRAPTKAEAAAIGKRVPPPLRDTIEWRGRLLWVASEQGVGRTIAAAYGKAPKPPTKLTTQSKFKIAPGTAYQRFNADIDDWLRFAHATVPVTVAYRRQDLEAGGTRLSDWHRASLRKLPGVIAELARETEPLIAQVGIRLVAEAESATLPVPTDLVPRFEAIIAAEREAKQAARAKRWDDLAAKAATALGERATPYAKMRTLEDLAPALAKLEKVLPLTAKRLRAKAKAGGLALRPGATTAAIAATEKALGAKLNPEYRALLAAFDGGNVGDVVLLGTKSGGARGDAELAAFSNAWCGDNPRYTIIAHSYRDRIIGVPRGASTPAYMLEGTPGIGAGVITRQSKALDTALDLALKAGKVLSNKAGG
jgi:hypothetical protein